MSFAIGLAIGLFLIGDGIYQLVKGRFPSDQSQYAEFEPETVVKAARLTGICFALMGVVILLREFHEKGYLVLVPTSWIYYIAAAVLLVLALVIAATVMKKR